MKGLKDNDRTSVINDFDAVFEGFVLLSNVAIDCEMFELGVMSSQNLFVDCPETLNSK